MCDFISLGFLKKHPDIVTEKNEAKLLGEAIIQGMRRLIETNKFGKVNSGRQTESALNTIGTYIVLTKIKLSDVDLARHVANILKSLKVGPHMNPSKYKLDIAMDAGQFARIEFLRYCMNCSAYVAKAIAIDAYEILSEGVIANCSLTFSSPLKALILSRMNGLGQNRARVEEIHNIWCIEPMLSIMCRFLDMREKLNFRDLAQLWKTIATVDKKNSEHICRINAGIIIASFIFSIVRR